MRLGARDRIRATLATAAQLAARSDWRYDPEINTEVEVRFIAEGETRTRVELEHRGLVEAYGDKAEEMYGSFDAPGGWIGILDHYSRNLRAQV